MDGIKAPKSPSECGHYLSTDPSGLPNLDKPDTLGADILACRAVNYLDALLSALDDGGRVGARGVDDVE